MAEITRIKKFRLMSWILCLFFNLMISGCVLDKRPQPVASNLPAQSIEIEIDEQNTSPDPLPSTEKQIDSPPVSQQRDETKPQTQTQTLIQTQLQLQPEKGRIPILYYHSIGIEAGNELRVPPEEFEQQLQYLNHAGYQSISLHQLYRHYSEGVELPEKAFVMTFDDGYEDNYSNAFRIAKKYQYTGTIFMVSDWIDGVGYLSKKHLQKLSQEGWEIEGHTKTHPKLNEMDSLGLQTELQESKKEIEKIINRPVRFLAYPYGLYSKHVIEETQKTGYLIGVTTERGWAKSQKLFQIQRVYCYAHMGLEEFKRRLENPDY